MAKVIVVYETKYGNTRIAAEEIIAGMKEVSGIETVLCQPKDIKPESIIDYDAIIIGTPTHIGRPTFGIRRFIGRLGKLNLEGKMVAVFDLRAGPDPGQAVKRMEKQLAEKAPGLKLITPGISVLVSEMKGPIADGELARCKEFGNKIAACIKG